VSKKGKEGERESERERSEDVSTSHDELVLMMLIAFIISKISLVFLLWDVSAQILLDLRSYCCVKNVFFALLWGKDVSKPQQCIKMCSSYY